MTSVITLIVLVVIMVVSVAFAAMLELRQKQKSEQRHLIRRLRWDAEQYLDLALAVEPLINHQRPTCLILHRAISSLDRILDLEPNESLAKVSLATAQSNLQRLNSADFIEHDYTYDHEEDINNAQKYIATAVKVLRQHADDEISVKGEVDKLIRDLMWQKLMVRVRSYLKMGQSAEGADRHQAHIYYRKTLNLLRNTDINHDDKNPLIKMVSEKIRENQRVAQAETAAAMEEEVTSETDSENEAETSEGEEDQQTAL